MTIADKLRLELLVREHLTRHGDEFYTELARILSKIQMEQLDMRGKPNLVNERN